MQREIQAADLFCGAGGTSTGLARACKAMGIPVRLLAINHWQIAVDSHTANHPWAEHRCERVEAVNPTVAIPSGRLDILVASPECTHFSVARGGKPKEDQKRASPWFVMDWISKLYVKTLLIENVPEFQTWGPLGADGHPLKSKKGETFRAFIHAIQSHGYQVSYRVLNAADYGAATSRRRLFILARRGHDLIEWPQQTHSKAGKVKGTKRWRGAREIIDWSLPNPSIFNRDRPLAEATMERIYAGIEKFGGKELQPFIVAMRGTTPKHIARSAKSIDDPTPAILAQGGHLGLAQPSFLMSNASGGAPRSTDEPTPTNVGGAGPALVEPFLLQTSFKGGNGGYVRSVEEPTYVQTGRVDQGVVEPFLMDCLGKDRPSDSSRLRTVDEPTFAQHAGGNRTGLVSAHLQTHWGEREGQSPRVHDIEEPTPAITQRGPALVEGVVIPYHRTSKPTAIEDPLNTFGTKDQFGLAQPHLQHVTHGGRAHDIEEPTPTITAAHRGELALVEPVVINGKMLDIRFRMLQPHELQGAMGFDKEYKFEGTRGERVRQIGNAVEVHVATALCRSLLKGVAA